MSQPERDVGPPKAVTSQALASRQAFRLGETTVRPSLRTIEWSGGRLVAEPRVMQVLMALVDAHGEVLTRDHLTHACWAGRIVGDDSINRVIGELRRIARETEDGFSVETIPRVGYRLVGTVGPLPEAVIRTGRPVLGSRRALLLSGLAMAGLAGSGLWWLRRDQRDPRAADLTAEGRNVLREDWPDEAPRAVRLFRQAVAIEPRNAQEWGLLAIAWRNVAEGASPEQTSAAVAACEDAARRALALDPRQADALAALAALHPYFGDWATVEDKLRGVLAIDPANVTALTHLMTLLQSVGRARESWALNARALAVEPLSPPNLFRKALKLWIFGRVAEADLVIDRALQLWPLHPAVWTARLYIFAFTGRPDAALRMIGGEAPRPRGFTMETGRLWTTSLTALRNGRPDDLARVREEIIPAASQGFAVQAIMILSMLGLVDAAFAVADGFLLRKGPLVGSLWPARDQMPVNDQPWRRTMSLFTPATASMRGDPRFAALCDGIGLTSYWRRRGIGPDAFLMNGQKRASALSPNSRGSPAVPEVPNGG